MKAIISTEGMYASVRLPANRRQMTGSLASVGLQHTLPYELPANGTKDDYHKQMELLKTFLEHGAISQAQYDKSSHDLTEKMGYSQTNTHK